MDRQRGVGGALLVVLLSVAIAAVSVFVIGDESGDRPDEDDDATPPVSTLELGPEDRPRSADLRSGRVTIQDNLWSDGDEQVAVWVDEAGIPYFGRRDRGSDDWTVEDLSRVEGNPFRAPVADNHHRFMVVGRDGQGRTHVAGNMLFSQFRSIRSNQAGTQWRDVSDQVDAHEATYPAYVATDDGALLLFRRVRRAGARTIFVDRLAPDGDSWRSVGPLLDGVPSGEGPYLHDVAVDPRGGTIHVLFVWRGDGQDPDSNSDLGYARSVDGGRSWETSGGQPLDLPITHDSAETVFATPDVGSGLGNGGGLTVDAQGRPHGITLLRQDDGPAEHLHVWHDGERWRRDVITGGLVDGRPALAGTSDGRVWMLGVRGTELRAVDITPDTGSRSPIPLSLVPQRWEVTYDRQALALHDRIEILVPDGSRPRVVVFDPVESRSVWVDEAASVELVSLGAVRDTSG